MLSTARSSKINCLINPLKICKRSFSATISDNEFKMKHFDHTVGALRNFFKEKGWREVHMQHRTSIMAACEDPWTIAPYVFQGQKWPLPQTSQMWLEHEMLAEPDVPGIYTLSTSYRQEPQPMPGRHEMIFPMFEFEGKGDYQDLRKLLKDLVVDLGLVSRKSIKDVTYNEACWMLNKETIDARDEKTLGEKLGTDVYCINRFPESSSPFWNMKRDRVFTSHVNENHQRILIPEMIAMKTDVIISGHETIGSAEREVDKDMMRERFETISGGRYAEKIRGEFGRERVDQELNEFLALDFFERYGGGIGLHRLISGMKKMGLFNTYTDYSEYI